MKELEPQLRHKLRIQVKKLRYASKFFAGAFPGKKAGRRRRNFLVSLERLQDALGELNDITVHEGLTKLIADTPSDDGRTQQDTQQAALGKRLLPTAFPAARRLACNRS